MNGSNIAPTALLDLSTQRLVFNSSANIAPSWHVGPRTFNGAGYVAHPLSYTGQPGPTAMDDPIPNAGKNSTAPGGVSTLISWPHPYTINGREPG